MLVSALARKWGAFLLRDDAVDLFVCLSVRLSSETRTQKRELSKTKHFTAVVSRLTTNRKKSYIYTIFKDPILGLSRITLSDNKPCYMTHIKLCPWPSEQDI